MRADPILPVIRCPATGRPVVLEGERLVADGAHQYPIVAGVPVLLDRELSLFDPEGVVAPSAAPASGGLRRRLGALPNLLSRNVGSVENYERLRELVVARARENGQRAKVLVVGGQILGQGMQALLGSDVDLVETDVEIGPRTTIVCDAHHLPFADETFDAVVCQAVLEHVIDPVRCAAEIYRVLAPGGFVYSEIPFMQQVHGGRYDFTRFTHLGHRRLWRCFDEIASGAQGGPGMALAWSIQYFLLALAGSSRPARAFARLGALAFAWLKFFDDRLVRRPGGVDAASGTYFLGQRRTSPVSDRQVLESFQGVLPRGQDG